MKVLIVLVINFVLVTSAPVDNDSVNQCDEGWIFHDDECFFLGTNSVTSWDDAQSRCWTMVSDLAVFADTAGLDTLLLSLKRTAPGQAKYWIGSTATSVDNADGLVNGPVMCDYIDLRRSLDAPLSIDCSTKNMGYICNKMLPDTQSNTSPLPLTTLSDAMTRQTVDAPTTGLPTTKVTTTDAAEEEYDETDDTTDVTTTDASDTDEDDDIAQEEVKALVGLSCRENWFLSPLGDKCYFIAPLFSSGSFIETLNYCRELEGRIVQPSTLEEFYAVDNITKQYTNWTEGPWVGLMRPFGDTRIILAGNGQSPKDDYATVLNQFVAQANATNSCGGYGPSPSTFKFWTCDLMGNPFCERSPEMDFYLVRMTAFDEQYGASSIPGEDVLGNSTTADQPEFPDEQ